MEFLGREYPLSITEYSIIVGVFKEESRAIDAIDMLRDAGFGDDQISYVVPEGDERSHSLLDNLMNLGLSEEEANYYKSELEAGRSIVTIRHDGRRSEILAILLLNGAKNYKYLKMSMHASKEPSNISAPARMGSHDRLETSQHSSSTGPSNTSAAHDGEALTGEEIASLRQLLEGEGLGHLL